MTLDPDLPAVVSIAHRLAREVDALSFGPPISHVYNPLIYAWDNHREYLTRYGAGPREVLLIGMNPGPFGMAQSGVPFGVGEWVRDWMGIRGPVGKPPREHPRRPIVGVDIERQEVSGARVYGWARAHFGAAEVFFSRFFIYNYCPLCFMEVSGANRTPDKLPAHERAPLLEICDRALREVALALRPRYVVGFGAWATTRAQIALAGVDVKVGQILHPSPASPAANRGWDEQATRGLRALGIEVP